MWEWLETRDPNVVATIAAAVAAVISLVTVVFNLRQMRQAEKERRAAICLEISRRYDELYETLIRLEGEWIEWDYFHAQFPKPHQKLNSEQWKLLRKAGGFFELVGAFVEEEFIDSELLFKFMNIRPRIWLLNKDAILEMRKTYFPELWLQWESLVKKYYESDNGRGGQKSVDEEAVREQRSEARAARAAGDGTRTVAKDPPPPTPPPPPPPSNAPVA